MFAHSRNRHRPLRPGRAAALVLGVLLGRVSAAGAQGTAPPAPALEWHAFASLSDVQNLDHPPSRTNAFRVFDFADHSLDLDVAEVTVARNAPRVGGVGFRVDLEGGQAVPRVSASSGLFSYAARAKSRDVDLQQAYLTVLLGRGVRVDVGKFVTPLGLEVIEGWDGYNDNASRSLLFGYAIPFTHTGLRVNVGGSRWSALVAVVNGWDIVRDNNGGKSVAAQLTLTPSDSFTLLVGGITGPEQAGNTHDFRTVYDVTATLKLSPAATLGFNADDGREAHTALDGTRARWRGAAAYARIGLTTAVALNLRGEVFDDPDGARTGTAQRLREITLTPELRLSPHVVTRVDCRVDRSNVDVFEARSGAKRTQRTVQFNMLFVF